MSFVFGTEYLYNNFSEMCKLRFDSPPGMKFCGICGTRLAQVCLVCGTANPPEYRFCGMCGTALGDGASPAQSVLAPVAAPVTAPPPVETADGAPSLEGERRIATVILADVQNSTDLMEQIGSEAWVNLMNQVLQRMETEIYRFGGVVDQFRGDGLVAFFGARAAHEDDPERAVLAGLAIQKTVKAYAADLTEQKDLDLKVRVGINTGEVIVTSVGDRLRHREDTAMGEAISIATAHGNSGPTRHRAGQPEYLPAHPGGFQMATAGQDPRERGQPADGGVPATRPTAG